MNQLTREQILKVRATGETNMFDTDAVAIIAAREGFYDLVVYIGDHKADYVHFILTGETSEEEVES